MSKVIRISAIAEEIALNYGDTVTDGIIAMQGKLHNVTDIEGIFRKVLKDGVDLSPKEKMAFQNLNRTLVDCMSIHNKI
jgi:hypothetical protein